VSRSSPAPTQRTTCGSKPTSPRRLLQSCSAEVSTGQIRARQACGPERTGRLACDGGRRCKRARDGSVAVVSGRTIDASALLLRYGPAVNREPSLTSAACPRRERHGRARALLLNPVETGRGCRPRVSRPFRRPMSLALPLSNSCPEAAVTRSGRTLHRRLAHPREQIRGGAHCGLQADHAWPPSGHARRPAETRVPTTPPLYGSGTTMFWFSRNRLFGSQCCFSSTKRWYFSSP
jgi:hypothetical protein